MLDIPSIASNDVRYCYDEPWYLPTPTAVAGVEFLLRLSVCFSACTISQKPV